MHANSFDRAISRKLINQSIMATKISHVGETFSFTFGGIIFIYVPMSIEPEGDKFTDESYEGRKTTIYPNGESDNVYWCADKAAFDANVASGKYIKIR